MNIDECPKCHYHHEINESHIGQDIDCGCGERIHTSLIAESAVRPKHRASFYRFFVCSILILILVCVCSGLGWGYFEIEQMNQALYRNQRKMSLGMENLNDGQQKMIKRIMGALIRIEGEIDFIKSDVRELNGADNLSEITEAQKRIDKNMQGLYDSQQRIDKSMQGLYDSQQELAAWSEKLEKQLWGEASYILPGDSLWNKLSDLKTQIDDMQINISSIKSDINFMKF